MPTPAYDVYQEMPTSSGFSEAYCLFFAKTRTKNSVILDFTILNYRSFRTEQTLSMIPATKDQEGNLDNLAHLNDQLSVLRSAIIYGANASGKSNLMLALRDLRELILSSGENEPDASFKAFQPFVFNPAYLQEPVAFEINFLMDGIRYSYKLSITKNTVLEESLHFYPSGKVAKLFIRKEQGFSFGDSLKGPKAAIESITAPNQLFLSKAALNNMELAIKVHRYFLSDFMPIPFLDSRKDNYYVTRLAKEIQKSGDKDAFLQNFRILLRTFDTGLVDFKVEEDSFFEGFDILIEHQLFDNDENEIGTSFQPFEQESTGTQKLFVIGGLVLRALMNGRVIMIDEFERSLHPHISSLILRMFNNARINTKNAQLIIATHDSNLLAKESMLRRDQVFIVEKDRTGSSELFALSDMEGIRKDIPMDKWYLSGRFGGIPNPETLNFELNFQHEEEVS